MKKLFKGILSIALLTALVSFTASCGNEGEGKTQAKKTDYSAPPLSGMDIMGKGSQSLEMYKGKVVFINFWATWCPPCRAEIPALIELQEKYPDDFVVFGVSVDRDGVDVVRKFYNEYGMNYPVIMGDTKMTMSYGGIRNIPTSFIVNRKGELVSKIVGSRSKEEFEAEISKFIREKG